MTEMGWLTCTESSRMLDFLSYRSKANATPHERKPRKMRLFAVACCRGVGQWIPDERSRRALETAEKQADGLVDDRTLQVAYDESFEAAVLFLKTPHLAQVARAAHEALSRDRYLWVGEIILSAVRFSVSDQAGYSASDPADSEELITATVQESYRQLGLLRELFGNPFRHVTFESAWRTERVMGVAQSIYFKGLFADLPILADALEEVGCSSADILDHCRQPGEHVRGCWALDMVLDRS